MSASFVGESKVIELSEGENVIGRGEKSGITDKKCSRKQVTVTFSSNSETVQVFVGGTNSSSYQAKGSPELRIMPNRSTFIMRDGDTLFLLGRLYPFVLKISKPEVSSMDTEDDFLMAAADEVMREEDKEKEDNDVMEGHKDEKSAIVIDDDIKYDKMEEKKVKIGFKSENYRLGLASLGTGILKFDPKRAAVIACEEIKNFLDKNRSNNKISIVLAEPNREVFEEFQANRPTDERFVLTAFSLAALPGEGLPCRYIACETNWRWKPADPEMNKMLASKDFFEKHKKLHSDVGKSTLVYETTIGDGTSSDNTVFVCVVPNGGNPSKADYIGDRVQAENALRNTYKTLFNKFNRYI